MAGQTLADVRTGRNGRHTLLARFRQAVFGRLAGYENVSHADRPGSCPAMWRVVGGRAVSKEAMCGRPSRSGRSFTSSGIAACSRGMNRRGMRRR